MEAMITSRESSPATAATARAIIDVVRSESGASAFARCVAESPQKILGTKNHGAAAWAFMSTFGGGLVSGDSYELAVDGGAGATLFLGNQSATKVFRGTSSMTLSARVGDGAMLVSWPHPVSCFAGANYVQNTLIEAAEGASVLLFDAWTSGRPAHEPPFSFESITTRTRVTCDETPLFAEGTPIFTARPWANAPMELQREVAPELLLVESGGDNLAAQYSRELVDYTLYVVDVAGGDKVPRKGGPGITQSDLLIVNKCDLAPHVGASLEVMRIDADRMRQGGPTVFAGVVHDKGVAQIVEHILAARTQALSAAGT